MEKDYVLDHMQRMVDEINEDEKDAPDRVVQGLVILIAYDSDDGGKLIRSFRTIGLRTWEALGMMDHMKNEFASQNVVAWIEE
jgi:hypothetical protein